MGDREYGDLEANYRASRRRYHRVNANRPLLHSMTLEFEHPFTHKFMAFKSPMPDDMWAVADDILRTSGTPGQRQEYGALQELRQQFKGAGGDGKTTSKPTAAALVGKRKKPSKKVEADRATPVTGEEAAGMIRVPRGRASAGSASARTAYRAVAALGLAQRSESD